MPRVLFAVVCEAREYHGKQVLCCRSGLIGGAKSCGTRSHVRVFTGTVMSAVETGDQDKLLDLLPDEVFLGDFKEATAVTNQACLDKKIQAGDRWLFYLDRDEKSGGLVLSYAGPSKPITDAEDEISMLRDLGHLRNAGVLTGTVELMPGAKGGKVIPFANHEVIATDVTSRERYTASTNHDGVYVFELPAGSYNVAAAPQDGLRQIEIMVPGSVQVVNGECWQRDLAVTPASSVPDNGTISGHLGSPDGKPFTVHPWVQIVSIDSKSFTSAYVDAGGNFEAKDVKPGRYVVGLGILKGAGYFSDVPVPVYYPGVGTKDQAIIIDLRPGEKRTNVDFQLPIEDVLKPLRRDSSTR